MLRVLVQMDVQNMVLECPGSISFESFMIPPAVVEKCFKTVNTAKFRGGGGECFIF